MDTIFPGFVCLEEKRYIDGYKSIDGITYKKDKVYKGEDKMNPKREDKTSITLEELRNPFADLPKICRTCPYFIGCNPQKERRWACKRAQEIREEKREQERKEAIARREWYVES